jgi:hypothetical protein
LQWQRLAFVLKLDVADRHAGAMIETLGRRAFDEMQAGRRLAIEAGLVRRELFVARRPVSLGSRHDDG